ncbi:MAG: biopolymer transporter ExbD [Deltaproteobacteria bacterium]|nr:biopolymer transporter ExbD [Deltaproteobacteria bacterium]
MAFSSGGSSSAMSEINVTPLVDVMLVLLIIFMVTAPLVQSGIKVDLPNAQAPAMPAGSDDKVRVTVARTDSTNPNSPIGVWVGRDQVTMDTLGARLLRDAVVQRDHEAFIQADEAVTYGNVVRVMGIMRAAGVNKLGIVTDPLSSQ